MNHPPIPPKSKLFGQDESGTYFQISRGWGACCVLLKSDDDDSPNAKGYDEEHKHWRPVIAACGEVEWRKRAERWIALSVRMEKEIIWRIGQRGCGNIFLARDRRMLALEREGKNCIRIALAWREWGAA